MMYYHINLVNMTPTGHDQIMLFCHWWWQLYYNCDVKWQLANTMDSDRRHVVVLENNAHNWQLQNYYLKIPNSYIKKFC